MNTGKVRIFIQPLGQRGGAFEVARVRNRARDVLDAVSAISGPFEVAYHAVREPIARPLRAGFACATGGGR
jgi:hypothetical protein